MLTEEDKKNPVWEDMDANVWLNAVYNSENCIATLFNQIVIFFKELAAEQKQQGRKVVLIESGQGPAYLQAKVCDDFDVLAGVDICQS